MSRIKARYSRSNKPRKGNKHPGIYGNGKNIAPVPACSYVNTKFNLPVGYVLALQELYPNVSIGQAIKAFLIANIQPKNAKEI